MLNDKPAAFRRAGQCLGRSSRNWSKQVSAALSTGILVAGLSTGAVAKEPTTTVIEYYNPTLQHYFMTADRDEAAMLDFGVIVPGWARSGVEFGAWADAADGGRAVAVYRFFGANVGNTHVYTSNPAERDILRKNPDWQDEGIAFYVAQPAGNSCAAGTTPIYRSWRSVPPKDNNHRFLPDLTMHENMARSAVLEGIVMCAPLSAKDVESDVVRLLEQTTFGPTDALVEQVKTTGVEAFVDQQLAMQRQDTSQLPWMPNSRPATCVDNATAPITPDSFCNRDNYSLYQVQRQFFVNALTGADQLRQRVAWALSQILVVSQTGGEVTMGYAMQRYQQMLADLAFDNYETILTRVTLSPSMGNYLDMVNNRKPTTTIQSNENYAREVLQLFSIGLWKLNLDGTLMLDAGGNPIPTYGQPEITNFARVFTGWTYPTAPGATRPNGINGTPNYDGQLEERPAEHDTTAKTLLDGAVVPANLSMGDDLANAISNIFNHPNVGPFISKQLIQKLVTAEPTPQYVARIASVFNNNGAGVRGDLKAVVRAIVLDPEARGATKLASVYGKLREPVLYMTGMARALNATSDGLFFNSQNRNNSMLQTVYNAPTVFNYYPADYTVPFTDVIGPEFGILTTTTAFARANYTNTFSFTGTIADGKAPLEQPQVNTLYGATGTQLDWSALVNSASNPTALVAKLDRLLMHNTMSSEAKNAVIAAVNAVAVTDLNTRARTAFYLVATSAQYQVER